MSGRKTFEFRRRMFARSDIRTVLIYSTKPVGCFVGEFDIAEILHATPDRLWALTRKGSGITKRYYDEYFSDRPIAYAMRIGAVRKFQKPICPADVIADFSPPQSYMYVGGMGAKIARRDQESLVAA